MDRLITSLDNTQLCAADKATLATIYTRFNQHGYRMVDRFFKNKKYADTEINTIKEENVLNRLVYKSIFGILYNQFCHLFNKIKNKLVNNRRLIDLSDQHFSNATGIGSGRQLWAYLAQIEEGFFLIPLCNRLQNNAGRHFSSTLVFESISAIPRFKNNERRTAMA